MSRSLISCDVIMLFPYFWSLCTPMDVLNLAAYCSYCFEKSMQCIFLLHLSKVFIRDLPINNHICKCTRPVPPRTYHPRVPSFFPTYIISKEIIGNLRCVIKWNYWLLRYLRFAPNCKYTIERLLTLEYNGKEDWLPCLDEIETGDWWQETGDW